MLAAAQASETALGQTSDQEVIDHLTMFATGSWAEGANSLQISGTDLTAPVESIAQQRAQLGVAIPLQRIYALLETH